MNGRDLLEGMNGVEQRYVQESEMLTTLLTEKKRTCWRAVVIPALISVTLLMTLILAVILPGQKESTVLSTGESLELTQEVIDTCYAQNLQMIPNGFGFSYIGNEQGAYRIHNGRITYLDYNTLQEQYLCSVVNCEHAHDKFCGSFFSERLGGNGMFALCDDKVYWLGSSLWSEGESVNVQGMDVSSYMKKAMDDLQIAQIIVMNADGTDRQVLTEFEKGEVIEGSHNFCAADGENLYLIIEKLTYTVSEDKNAYIGAEKKYLVACNRITGEKKELCTIPAGLTVISCEGEYLIARTKEAVLNLAEDEAANPELLTKAMNQSGKTSYFKINVMTGEMMEIASLYQNDGGIIDNTLYYTSSQGEIIQISLMDGSKKVLAQREGIRVWPLGNLVTVWKDGAEEAEWYIGADGTLLPWRGDSIKTVVGNDEQTVICENIRGSEWCLVYCETEDGNQEYRMITLNELAEGRIEALRRVQFLD